MDLEDVSLNSTVLEETVEELKSRYENLKEERRKLVTQIHEIKCKMTETRSQEDDILREVRRGVTTGNLTLKNRYRNRFCNVE